MESSIPSSSTIQAVDIAHTQAAVRIRATARQPCHGEPGRARARGVRLGWLSTGVKVDAAVRAVGSGGGDQEGREAVGAGNGTVSRIKAAMTAAPTSRLLPSQNR